MRNDSERDEGMDFFNLLLGWKWDEDEQVCMFQGQMGNVGSQKEDVKGWFVDAGEPEKQLNDCGAEDVIVDAEEMDVVGCS